MRIPLLSLALVTLVTSLQPLSAKQAESKPIFCKLSSAEMRARLGDLRADFMTNIVAVDEMDNGFRYWVEKSPEHLVMLANFIEFESACCGFMDFNLSLASEADRVSLALTGPEGTKSFLTEMMSKVEFDWAAGEQLATGSQ